MPGPPEDIPRWQPPNDPTDVPRWEPPPPSRDVPRWEPDADVRARPPRPGGPVGARWEVGEAPVRRAPVKRASRLVIPFLWWRRHPWVLVWICVFLAPGAGLLLRLVDESGWDPLVAPLAGLFIAFFALALLRGALASVRHSFARLALGVGAALVALAVLLWPVVWVTMGRVTCPARAGTDLGVPTSAIALDAWRRSEAGDSVWHGGAADARWRDTTRGITLLDYQLVESGCWERIAPIDATRTWHDFRVTIREGGRAPLSKVVIVHTAVERGGWKITGIEGPLP